MSTKMMAHNKFATFDPNVRMYASWDPETVEPWIYTDWIDETMSWKESCYIHVFLSGATVKYVVKGPDAEKLMSDTFVNGFTLDKFKVGRTKHAIACSPDGNVAMHGVCMRTAEDEFVTYGLDPHVPMQVFSGKYNVEVKELNYSDNFIFQVAGPRSLELVENAMKEDIHDLPFMGFRYGKIAGRDMDVLRMGMAGTLAYELHGSADDAEAIYNEIVRVGKKYGLRRLGLLSYMSSHTENGFPQWGTHFIPSWHNDPACRKYFGLDDEDAEFSYWGKKPEDIELHGSMSDQGLDAYLANPIELGWKHMINWNHDFVGKEALLKIKEDPRTRGICSLEWNAEDILKIFAAYYDDQPDLPDMMMYPQNYFFASDGNLSDKVLDADGKLVGRSTGICYTRYYKKTISLGILDPEQLVEGKELTLIWGTAGTRQIPIRVKVSRYPYLDLASNKDFDLETIPHYQPEA